MPDLQPGVHIGAGGDSAFQSSSRRLRLKNHTIPPSAASRLTSLNKSFHFTFFFFLGCFFFENSRRSWLRKIDRRSPEESGVFLGGVGKEEEVDEAGGELGEVAVAK